MNCFSEFHYALYVDGELASDEVRHVDAHLFMCPRCRELVESLRAENRLLAEVLQKPEAEWAPEKSVLGSLLWTCCSAVGLVVVLDILATQLGQMIPSGAGWLNPLSPTTLVSLFFRGANTLASEGVAMFDSLITTLAILFVGLSIIAGLYLLMKRRTSLPLALLAGLALLVITPTPTSAIETRSAKNVTVAKGETVDGTLLAAGDTVNIDGTVNGDLIASGKNITVRGTVKGDVLVFSQSLEVDGNVTGNVYSFVQLLTLSGTVEHNFYGFVQTLQMDRDGRVGADMLVGSGEPRLRGTVGRDAMLFAGNLGLEGRVGRDVRVHCDNVHVSSGAQVGGDLQVTVHHNNDVRIDPGAAIKGKTEIKLLKAAESSPYARPKFYFWKVVELAAALLTGLVLFWIFPRLFASRPKDAMATLKAAGIGFLALVATPIGAIVLCVTLVGLPLGILAVLLWIVSLYLAKIFVASFIGQEMLKTPAGLAGGFAKSLLLGLFILFVAMNVPYVGGWIKFLVLLLGLGLMVVQAYQARRPAPAA